MKKSNTIITNHSKSEDQMDQRMPKGSKGIEESKSFGDGTQEGSITRRQFVVGAGTALAGGAIGIVGGSLLPSGDVAIAGTTKKWNKETDVIVVGGGAAGIFGALSNLWGKRGCRQNFRSEGGRH